VRAADRAGAQRQGDLVAHKIRHGHAVYALKQAQTLADYKAI
jgi:hypothetical protein